MCALMDNEESIVVCPCRLQSFYMRRGFKGSTASIPNLTLLFFARGHDFVPSLFIFTMLVFCMKRGEGRGSSCQQQLTRNFPSVT